MTQWWVMRNKFSGCSKEECDRMNARDIVNKYDKRRNLEKEERKELERLKDKYEK